MYYFSDRISPLHEIEATPGREDDAGPYGSPTPGILAKSFTQEWIHPHFGARGVREDTMSKRRLARLVVYLVIGLTVALVARTHRAARTRRPPAGRDVGIMRPVGDFTLLTAATGEPVSLHDLRGARAVVIVFTGIGCPVSELYMTRLAELEEAYRGRGVAFLAVNANAHDTAEEVSAHARDHGVAFPVFKDPDNALADRLLAERTCEAFVLDGARRLRYRGAIDDQYGRGTRKDGPSGVTWPRRSTPSWPGARSPRRSRRSSAARSTGSSRGWSSAGARGSGRPPRRSWPLRKAKGAADRGGAGDATPRTSPRSFRQKCQSCHRPGQVGPFPLLTYDDARRRGQA